MAKINIQTDRLIEAIELWDGSNVTVTLTSGDVLTGTLWTTNSEVLVRIAALTHHIPAEAVAEVTFND